MKQKIYPSSMSENRIKLLERLKLEADFNTINWTEYDLQLLNDVIIEVRDLI